MRRARFRPSSSRRSASGRCRHADMRVRSFRAQTVLAQKARCGTRAERPNPRRGLPRPWGAGAAVLPVHGSFWGAPAGAPFFVGLGHRREASPRPWTATLRHPWTATLPRRSDGVSMPRNLSNARPMGGEWPPTAPDWLLCTKLRGWPRARSYIAPNLGQWEGVFRARCPYGALRWPHAGTFKSCMAHSNLARMHSCRVQCTQSSHGAHRLAGYGSRGLVFGRFRRRRRYSSLMARLR